MWRISHLPAYENRWRQVDVKNFTPTCLWREMEAGRCEEFHTYLPMEMEQSVPKRRHIKFRRRGITQKKAKNRKIPALDWNETPSVWIRASHCGYWANKICGYLDCGMIPVSRLHQANPLLVTDLVSHWTTGWSTLSATRLPKCTLQCAVTFFTALLELWRWGR